MDEEVPLGNGDAIGDNDGMDVDDHDRIENDEDFGKIIKKQAAMFLAAMLAQPNIAHTTVDRLIYSVTDLVQQLVNQLEAKTRRLLQICGIDLKSQQCADLFDCFSFTGNPFTGLESRYRRGQYFVKELGLV